MLKRVRDDCSEGIDFGAVLAVQVFGAQIQLVLPGVIVRQLGSQHVDGPRPLQRRDVGGGQPASHFEASGAPRSSQGAVAVAARQLGRLDLETVAPVILSVGRIVTYSGPSLKPL